VVSTPKQPDDDPRFNTLNKQPQQKNSSHAETNREQRESKQRNNSSSSSSSSIVCTSNSTHCSSISSAIRVSICLNLFRAVRYGIDVVRSSSGSRLSFQLTAWSIETRFSFSHSSLFSPFEMVVPLYQLYIDGSLLSSWHHRGLDWSGSESGLSVSLWSPPCCLLSVLVA